MRKQLITALVQHANQALTPQVAREILDQLFPARAYPPQAFGQRTYKGYTFQAESMTGLTDEIHPLHRQHYLETDKHRAGIAMNPDYEGFAERERSGSLIQFTSRTLAGELVGHMRVVIGTSTHTQTLFCEEDSFYVVPAHRGGFMAVRLWQFVEDSVRSIGVREVRFGSRLANRADQMAKYLKYTPVATQFVKILD